MSQLAIDLPPAPARPVHVLAYGGGLDSFAVLLDQLEQGNRPDAVAFCDVTDPERKDPGEWAGTYRHLREVVMPLCRREGIPFEWIDTARYPVRDARSLFAWLWARGQIPVAGPDRICTIVAKVERFQRWLVDTFPGRRCVVWVGFEAGEESRARNDPNAGKVGDLGGGTVRVNRFPLMERGLCRCRAEALVRRLGYPVPRKSACMMCPYGSRGDWQRFAREEPAYFEQVVQLEARKPPTKNGKKLSIMDYRTHRDDEGRVIRIQNPMLPEFIAKPYKPRRIPCDVCGAPQRATKATGCDYLYEQSGPMAAMSSAQETT